jgi:hypothetical protein
MDMRPRISLVPGWGYRPGPLAHRSTKRKTRPGGGTGLTPWNEPNNPEGRPNYLREERV